jgi:hypothetical protein
MTNLTELFREAIHHTRNNEGIPGKIGRHDGFTTTYTDTFGVQHKERVWVRLGPDEAEMVAVCIKVPHQYDAGVRVANRGGVPTVIGADDSQAVAWAAGGTNTAVGPHRHDRRSGDPDYVEGLRLLPLLVTPTTPESMRVKIYEGIYYSGTTPIWFPSATSADLSSYIPADGTVHFVILAIDAITNTLVIVDGEDIEDTPLFPAEVTGALVTAVTIDEDYQPLAAIRFQFGQTVIRLSNIVFDMRRWITGSAGSAAVGFAADAIMTDADGAVMVDADGNVMIEA